MSAYPQTADRPQLRRAARTPGALRRVAEEENRRSFLRMVSHELRTPLNSIIGFSEIIARELHGPLNEPRYREHAEIIRESGLKLLKLVNDVVEIARLEAHAVDLDLHSEDPRHLIEDTVEELEPEASAKGVSFALDIHHPGRLMADDRALKTVLLQVLQNAVAYSPTGGVVRISVRGLGESVILEITDQGPGVPNRDIARVLRPFEQGENALVRRSEGAGLGLPIARLLCEAMGGRLRLRSPPGEGLTIAIRLPAA